MPWLLTLLALTTLLLPRAGFAEEIKNKGLYISPLRNYTNISPGKQANSQFVVANLTDHPADITLSTGQFTAADYTYSYQFAPDSDQWVHLAETSLQLQPGKSKTIAYSIDVPSDSTPGGHYFTILATAQTSASPSKVQAITVIYIIVDGELTKSSQIVKTELPFINFGHEIRFNLHIKNTGNSHFFAYTSGQLSGLSASTDRPQTTNLLMPGKTRIIGSTIPAPLLPGIYQATYGYKTDDSQNIQKQAWILYLPPWSLLIPIGCVWLYMAIRRRRKPKFTGS